MTDIDIINLYKDKKYKYLKILSNEMLNYVNNKYSDSTGKESLYRILFNIDEIPKCPICNNNRNFDPGNKNRKNTPYLKTCGNIECINELNKQHVIEHNQLKYGTNSYAQTKDFSIKFKQTCLDRYGVEAPSKLKEIRDKQIKTCLEKYGVEWASSTPDFKNKVKKTCLEKYGVEYGFQSDITKQHIKDTMIKKYGVDNIMKLESMKQHFKDIATITNKKRRETGIKNKSFGPKSKEEDKCYELLKRIYPDIIRQYTSKEYPWMCDFYVPSKKLYIEYQGYYTHGKHKFNKENIRDQIEVERLKNKYGEECTQIIIWTIKDVKKREMAKKNNLNYLEFFTLDEVEKYIELNKI